MGLSGVFITGSWTGIRIPRRGNGSPSRRSKAPAILNTGGKPASTGTAAFPLYPPKVLPIRNGGNRGSISGVKILSLSDKKMRGICVKELVPLILTYPSKGVIFKVNGYLDRSRQK
jgi:hypothetical protein